MGSDGSSDRLSRLEGFLRSMDANGNGVLELSEVPPDRQRILQFFAGRVGLDASQPIPISRIRESFANRTFEHGGSTTPPGSPPPGQPEKKSDRPDAKKDQKAEPPLVPGFGTDETLLPVPGFGVKVADGLASLAPSASASAFAGMDSRTREFAEERFRRYDRNQSGVLEKDEWGEMRGDPQAMDRNHDGRITPDEYAAGIAEYLRSRGSRGGGDSHNQQPDGGKVAGAETSAGADRPFRRFLTPHERLPEGLPSWFAGRDSNRDGQVAMAEYATSWSDDTAREFRSLDLNGDGFLTPQECLKASAGTVATSDQAASGLSSSGSSRSSGSDSSGESTPWWMR